MPNIDHMPTMGKLVMAVGTAALGWIVSDMIRNVMPPQTAFGAFNFVNLVLGGICGWIVAGPRLGYGYRHGISAGMTGVGALVFWGLFVQSFNQMIAESLRNRYEGPIEAFEGMFDIAVDYGEHLLHVHLWVVLVMGAVVIGLIGEWAEQKWQ